MTKKKAVQDATNLPITESEWMKMVDEARYKRYTFKDITPEQRKFLRYCREATPPVTYEDMCRIWIKCGWPRVDPATINNWCKYMEAGR